MAKTKMLCPFSNQLCRECPQYRGRHYFLCYHTKYRGYMGDPEKEVKKKSWTAEPNPQFDIPLLYPPSPKWVVLNDIVERKDK